MTVTHPRELPDDIMTECTLTLDDGLVEARHSQGRAGTQSQITSPNWTARISTGDMLPRRRAMWESWRNSLQGRPFLAWDTSLSEMLAYPAGHPAFLSGAWNGQATIASMTADSIALSNVPANLIVHVGDRIGLIQNGRYGYHSLISSVWGGPVLSAGPGTTLAASSTLAPNGLLQASDLVETATSGAHVSGGLGLAATAGQQHTYSFHVHQSSSRLVELIAATTVTAASVFNPATGQFVSGTNFIARGAEILSGGWWRVWMTVQSASSGTLFTRANMHDGVSSVYAGNGASRLVLWGQQLTLGADGASGPGMTVQVAPFINPIGTPIFTTAATVVLRRPRLLMTIRPGTWRMDVNAVAVPASFEASQVL